MAKTPAKKQSPIPIIVVGTGHHFQRNLTPALKKLSEEGLISLIMTVDILARGEKNDFHGVDHMKRNTQPLSTQLKQFKDHNPIIILGHTNSLHAKDAYDLLSHGFRIIVEKPYALTPGTLKKYMSAADDHQCALLEYYLTMKTVPLLYGYGMVDQKSFYSIDHHLVPTKHLRTYASSVSDFWNALPAIVGTIQEVEVEVLEGEGETGTLEGRGVDTIDIRSGGGMLQDMGTHAIAPLLPFEQIIGSFSKNSCVVQVARAREYMSMVKRRFALPLSRIGETYAEWSYMTSKRVRIEMRVGKYVFGDRNRRGIRLKGSHGEVYMDWNTCTLSVNGTPVLEMEKNYYTVVRAAIEDIARKPLFTFDARKIAARSQEMVFDIQKQAYKKPMHVYYPRGTNPDAIFSNEGVFHEHGVDDESLRPEDHHNEWLSILGDELPRFFPPKKREHVTCPGCNSADVDTEFLKLGFIYKWCRHCYTLYASPRPSEAAIDAFYRDSNAMKFYGEQVFRATQDARQRHQIAPLVAWVKTQVKHDVSTNLEVLDFMPKFFSVWTDAASAYEGASVFLVDPVHVHRPPKRALITTIADVGERQFDAVTAFDVLDHRANPDETVRLLSGLTKKNGVLLLTLNTGGFEYQVLGRDAHRLVPPSRLNLLTLETVEGILHKHGYEITDISTSGLLDVDIVHKTFRDDQSVPIDRFIAYVLKRRGAATYEALQNFLRENNLSSFLRVAARKRA